MADTALLEREKEVSGQVTAKVRYKLLDSIRGFTVINMVLFHAIWDIVYIFGADWDWYRSRGAYIWQQAICMTFILLSGLCWRMGKHPLKRGLTVFCGGLIITAGTLIFMPQDRIIFGVLTLIGSCMLLMIPLDVLLRKVNPYAGAACSLMLFILTKGIGSGTVSLFGLELIKLPQTMYSGYISSYFGFPSHDFFSTDYFPLLPWLMLFITGYFLCPILTKRRWFADVAVHEFAPLSFIGRHSLLIYMLHQPVVYGVLWVWFSIA